MNGKTFSLRTLKALLAISFCLLLVHLIVKYVSIVIHNDTHGFLFELSNRFDVNDENSVPQWFSQILFLSIGVSALFAAYLQKLKSRRLFWITIGVVGILLSLDDVATLHEFILQSIHNSFFLDIEPTLLTNAWLVLMPLVLIIGILLAIWAYRVLPRRTMVLLIVGGVVYVFGKILMDSLANEATSLFMDRGVMQGLEKLFQYTGSSIVLYGVFDYIETNYASRVKAAIKTLRGSSA